MSWEAVNQSRFWELEPMLSFPNPAAEKQDKLKRAGIIRWAGYVEPMVHLWQRQGQGVVVPMGAAWSNAKVECDRVRQLAAIHGATWLMDHQKTAVIRASEWRSGVIVAPCGAGKTQMGVALHRFAMTERPTLVLVHTRDLATQWDQRVRRLLGMAPVSPSGAAAFVKAATAAMINVKGMVITTVQTLAKVDPWDLTGMRFGTVILDEAHHAPASTFQAVLGNIVCDTVYGLTATPNRDDGWTPAMYAWLGPKRYEVQARDLQRVGLTMAPTVCEVVTPFHSWSGDFTTIVNDLTDSGDRNALIARLVAEHGTFPQLVLTSRVEHAEALAALIPDAVAVVGRTRDRDAAFARVRAGDAKVLIATQLADEGLDLPELVAVHLVAPCRAGNRVIQRIGRVMRASSGKARPVVYDYVDNMSLLQSQWRSRRKACLEQLPGVTFTRKVVA
jgi:superfamily II DNA or RNA helicase